MPDKPYALFKSYSKNIFSCSFQNENLLPFVTVKHFIMVLGKNFALIRWKSKKRKILKAY